MEAFTNHLPTLVMNGATLLVIAVLLVRVIAKVIERISQSFTQGVMELRTEIRELRADIRTVGQQTATAVGQLTERVSRVEGKIEGIALSSQMSDEDRTPITNISQIPGRPQTHDDNVWVDPDLIPTPRPTPRPPRQSPPRGLPVATGTTYSMTKPHKKPT